MTMSSASRRLAGILLIVLPTVMFGGVYLAYIGAVVLAVGVFVLGIGLVRRPAQRS
jgi:hypothetical protein